MILGCAWYPEHWDEARWPEDIRLMRLAGINMVRIAEFAWSRLKGKRVLVDHGQQPMAMFRYACFKSGLDFKEIVAVDAGSTDAMIATAMSAPPTSNNLLEPSFTHVEIGRAHV